MACVAVIVGVIGVCAVVTHADRRRRAEVDDDERLKRFMKKYVDSDKKQ
jgi:FtsZ-interacting cell division protein ZipA